MIPTERILAETRFSFPAFYDSAKKQEAGLMDVVVLARVVMLLGIGAQATHGIEPAQELQRGTDKAEATFTTARALARATAAFRLLPERERCRIEESLFAVDL